MRRLWINFSVLLLTVGIFLLLCEAVFRTLKIGRPYDSGSSIFTEYDPYLGWKNKPDFCGTHTSSEYSVYACYNAKGLRGREFSYSRPEGVFRILILGDSFAEGFCVKSGELFSEILSRMLNGNGIAAEVINAGTAGYSTDQELLFFLREGRRYSPDLVILMFYENDIWYNTQPRYWRGYKPYFRYSGEEFALMNVPVPPQERRVSAAAGAEDFFSAKSYFYNFIKEKIKNLPFAYAAAAKLGLIGKAGARISVVKGTDGRLTAVPEEFLAWRKAADPQVDEAWRVTAFLIKKLKEESALLKSRLLVFYVPSIAEIYERYEKEAKRKYGLTGRDWDIAAPGKGLEDICRLNGIDFVNPAPQLRRESGMCYFPIDGHWNKYGHESVGRSLFSFITAHYTAERQ